MIAGITAVALGKIIVIAQEGKQQEEHAGQARAQGIAIEHAPGQRRAVMQITAQYPEECGDGEQQGNEVEAVAIELEIEIIGGLLAEIVKDRQPRDNAQSGNDQMTPGQGQQESIHQPHQRNDGGAHDEDNLVIQDITLRRG